MTLLMFEEFAALNEAKVKKLIKKKDIGDIDLMAGISLSGKDKNKTSEEQLPFWSTIVDAVGSPAGILGRWLKSGKTDESEFPKLFEWIFWRTQRSIQIVVGRDDRDNYVKFLEVISSKEFQTWFKKYHSEMTELEAEARKENAGKAPKDQNGPANTAHYQFKEKGKKDLLKFLNGL